MDSIESSTLYLRMEYERVRSNSQGFRDHFTSLHSKHLFFSNLITPWSLSFASHKLIFSFFYLVKVIEVGYMKTSQTPACDCLFWNMYSSYQEHPMGSDTCLQHSPGSLHGPHQSKNTAALQRLLVGSGNRGKQINQRDSVFETSHIAFDHYSPCRHAAWFELYVPRF